MVTAAQHKAHLEKIRKGLATRVRILVPGSACPVCQAAEGAYNLDDPRLDNELALPLEACSCEGGCQAFYAPVLDRFGP